MTDKVDSNIYKAYLEMLNNGVIQAGPSKLSDIRMLNPLVLAYVGDSVYDTFVRTLLVSGGYGHVAKLHKLSIGFVKAKAQADILARITEFFTPEEQDVVRRGRNTKSYTVPKNADMADYRHATGFEALIGYLYLTGQIERLMEIIKMIIDVKSEEVK